MQDIATTVDAYIAMWNETDPERRRALVADALTEDASYVDPLMSGDGRDAIAAMIGEAQAQFPGHRFALSAGPDLHHDRVRFAWRLAADAADAVAAGLDFATVADDGRLRAVTGFLEPVA